MISYHYLALNREGRKIKGTIEANSTKEAFAQLRPRSLTVISLRKKHGLSSFSRENSTQAGKLFAFPVKNKEIIIFLRQFATLIIGGLPVVQALDVMIRQTNHAVLKKGIVQVKKDVEAGMPLSEAMAKHPKIFSSFIHNMVRAGEAGGVLNIVLTRLTSYLESTENIAQRVKAAIRYPVFVMLMAAGLIGALVFFVLPEMQSLFEDSFQAELPFITQIILDLSDFVRTKFYFVILIIGAFGFVYYYLPKKYDRVAYLIDVVKLKIPVIGKLYHRICLSRFTRTLAILFTSGVPILDSLDMTAKTSGNKVIEKAIMEAKSSLKEGETIAEPLSNCPVFPPMVVSMISVGEKTGALDQMLNKISDFYDHEIETTVDSLASLIEPLLLGFLGVTVGIAVVAMYLPYFSIFEHIGG